MNAKLLDQFDKELEVEYRGEMYRVRDNGSVCRQRRPNKPKRPLDAMPPIHSPAGQNGWFEPNSTL